jgi:hypothetical protein
MIINSIISIGYLDLLETFFRANNLQVTCSLLDDKTNNLKLITLEYEDNSETALAITFMSIRHLGFENMLVDYLIKCGAPRNLISVGRTAVKRDMKKLDEEWAEKRRELGFR